MTLPWIIRVATALSLYGLVFITYTLLLKHYDISVLYPLYTALSIMGVSLIGILYFGESMSAYKIVGMMFLFIGIGLISLPYN